MGCNSHNHPSVNDLLSPLIVAHGAGGEANPTGLWLTWACQWVCAFKFGFGPDFPSEEAKTTATSLGCVGSKAQVDSEIFSLTPASSVPIPISGSKDWGGHPFQAHALVSTSQQIEAVNIDILLLQGFFNALPYLGTIKRTHHYQPAK